MKRSIRFGSVSINRKGKTWWWYTFDAYISIIDETGHRSTRWPKTIRNYTASQSTAFAYERLDLFVYHDGSMSLLVSPTSILPISSSSLLSFSTPSLSFFFSFKNSRCDTQREEPWEKFMWLAQTRPEFDSGTYCSFQLYGTPRSIAYRL